MLIGDIYTEFSVLKERTQLLKTAVTEISREFKKTKKGEIFHLLPPAIVTDQFPMHLFLNTKTHSREIMLEKLKNTLKKYRSNKNVFLKSVFTLLFFLRNGGKFLLDKSYRSVAVLALRNPEGLHQTTNRSKIDRYPLIFKACQEQFRNRDALRILSFGCATGEEVITLRRYFPSAFLVGADINPWNLKECKRKVRDENIVFIPSEPELLEKHGPYDIIFCMAVLQRTPHLVETEGITDLGKLYPFEKFDRQLRELDSVLKQEGLFVVHNAHYLFSDASIAGRYQELKGVPTEKEPLSIKFDKNSLRINMPVQCGFIFRKSRSQLDDMKSR